MSSIPYTSDPLEAARTRILRRAAVLEICARMKEGMNGHKVAHAFDKANPNSHMDWHEASDHLDILRQKGSLVITGFDQDGMTLYRVNV